MKKKYFLFFIFILNFYSCFFRMHSKSPDEKILNWMYEIIQVEKSKDYQNLKHLIYNFQLNKNNNYYDYNKDIFKIHYEKYVPKYSRKITKNEAYYYIINLFPDDKKIINLLNKRNIDFIVYEYCETILFFIESSNGNIKLLFSKGLDKYPDSEILYIDFRKDFPDNISIIGFSGKEDFGRWTNDYEAEIKFDKLSANNAIELILFANAFGPNKNEFTEIRIGNVSQLVKFDKSMKFYRLKYKNVQNADSIIIYIAEPVTPSELKISDDTRKLGIGIKKLALVSCNEKD